MLTTAKRVSAAKNTMELPLLPAPSRPVKRSFAEDVEAMGLVGERQNAEIIFLALVSRLLERPVSISVKGASSSGKSVLVDTAQTTPLGSAHFSVLVCTDVAAAQSGSRGTFIQAKKVLLLAG